MECAKPFDICGVEEGGTPMGGMERRLGQADGNRAHNEFLLDKFMHIQIRARAHASLSHKCCAAHHACSVGAYLWSAASTSCMAMCDVHMHDSTAVMQAVRHVPTIAAAPSHMPSITPAWRVCMVKGKFHGMIAGI